MYLFISSKLYIRQWSWFY